MIVAAYFTLTADGFLPRAEDKDLPPPDTILEDSDRHAEKLGSLIVGRASYESMDGDESPVPLVVVSKRHAQTLRTVLTQTSSIRSKLSRKS